MVQVSISRSIDIFVLFRANELEVAYFYGNE